MQLTIPGEHKKFILDSVENYFAKESKPIFLSELGGMFSKEYGNFKRKYNCSIREFLEAELSDKVSIAAHNYN